MTYPFIRLVQDHDYQRVWDIWMQKHVIKWMSFKPADLETFKATFDKLNKQSDIYVLIDEIEGQETIVGVRQIKYLSGCYAHNELNWIGYVPETLCSKIIAQIQPNFGRAVIDH